MFLHDNFGCSNAFKAIISAHERGPAGRRSRCRKPTWLCLGRRRQSWNRIKITANGSALRKYKNEQLVLSIDGATRYTSGMIGLMVEGGTAYVDNLRIRSHDDD